MWELPLTWDQDPGTVRKPLEPRLSVLIHTLEKPNPFSKITMPTAHLSASYTQSAHFVRT